MPETKVILISQYPLPWSEVGSWTTLYKNYLESGNHRIDYLICTEPHERFDSVAYRIAKENTLTKIKQKLVRNNKLAYLKALKKLLRKDQSNFVIQIVDNFGIVNGINELLLETGARGRCYLQYFYHGFMPFLNHSQAEKIFGLLNEVVLLTADSRKIHEQMIGSFPLGSVLHNGIDTGKFYPVSAEAKLRLKAGFGQSGKRVFLWCSQDKPKKGLAIALQAWKEIYPKYDDIVLFVVGVQSETPAEGVVFFGKQPNDQLPQYYQAADCYLFPTLYDEGFGMSLIEAMHCGCYCMASAKGGVPEVLQNGALGKLIENPEDISRWSAAITEYLDGAGQNYPHPGDLYTTIRWNHDMNQLIEQAKLRLT